MPSDIFTNNHLEDHLDMTLREWIERFQSSVVMEEIRYSGVRCLKNVYDLWVIQEIIHETKPDLVIEIGCKYGGTTLWLSDLLRTFKFGAVLGIDIAVPLLEARENLQFIKGSSIDGEVMRQVKEQVAGRRAMVIADGNHAAAHVLEELRLYGPLVGEGCYFIAEDGIVDVMNWTRFTPGPREAVREFLKEDDTFEIDDGRTKFIITYAPDGFLRKKGRKILG